MLEAMRNNTTPAVLFPVVSAVCIALFFFYYKKTMLPRVGTTEWIEREVRKNLLPFFRVRRPMEEKDVMPLAVILALFSILALFNLGDSDAPQSFFQFTQERGQVTVELDQPEEIGSIMFYTGLWTGSYTLEFSADGTSWSKQEPQSDLSTDDRPSPAMNQQYLHLFKWQYAKLSEDNLPVQYIRITSSSTPIELGELALFDSNNRLLPRIRISNPDAPELFDEQHTIPERPTYLNSMYFDEIYHGRTALEHLRNVKPYENTHPPLGKEIIAASVSIFGMTPFGWRFIGAVFGVLMLAVMYILIKNMFGKTVVAVCGTLLFGFDFMRFVQTRIATIDTYGVFFILLSFFFMYRYITTSPDAAFRKSLVPLALSGLSFGLGCASKWIVFYAGAGLAVLYIIRLVMLGKHFINDAKPGFSTYLTKTLLWSVLFFVLIPAVIYCLSYIPYGLAEGMTISGGMLRSREFYKIIWDNQVLMYNYHSNLSAEHPYSSFWWQWILNIRPILYYYLGVDGMRSSIAAFGNPIVWWGGLAALAAVFISMVKHRDAKAMFIIIGYLTQILPWVAVSRIVFVYHYFPSTLFLVLALAYVFNTLIERKQGRHMQIIYGYTAYAGAVFALFYPALTGVAASHWYYRNLLRWIPHFWS